MGFQCVNPVEDNVFINYVLLLVIVPCQKYLLNDFTNLLNLTCDIICSAIQIDTNCFKKSYNKTSCF